MSLKIDDDRPYTDAEKRWLHEWGLDYKIEENERRFAQSELHDAGEPVDLKAALTDAGVEVPPPPANPSFVDGSPITAEVQVPSSDSADEDAPFDEEAARAELNDWTVPELKAELRERELSQDGNKPELVDRLVDALKEQDENPVDDDEESSAE